MDITQYDTDPRVRRDGDRYVITLDGTDYTVLRTPGATFGWAICAGPNMEYIAGSGPNGLAIGYGAADTAIRALIGDPQ